MLLKQNIIGKKREKFINKHKINWLFVIKMIGVGLGVIESVLLVFLLVKNHVL